MLDSGPPGFGNAPIVKSVMIVSAFLSFFTTLIHAQRSVGFQLENGILKSYPELWRIFTAQFVFTSASELLFGFVLLYYFRIFERQMGSRKFAFFVFFMVISSTLAYTAILVLFPRLEYIVSGPYPIIFGSFVLFFADIPVAHKYTIYNSVFTDKSFIYLLGFQMLLASPSSSIFAGFLSMICGYCYRAEAMRFRRIEVPEGMASFFRERVLPVIDTEAGQPYSLRNYFNRQRNEGNGAGDIEMDNLQNAMQGFRGEPANVPREFGMRNPQDNTRGDHHFVDGFDEEEDFNEEDFLLPQYGQQHPNPANAPPFRAPTVVQPSQDNINSLVSMGFAHEDATRALVQSNNDVQRAANFLLGAS